MPRKNNRKINHKKKKYPKRQDNKKNYANNRALAIQRATFVPQTKLLEFVYDETFLLRGNGLDKDTNSMGLQFTIMNVGAGPAYLGPFWGAYDQAVSAQQSDRSLTAPVQGWDRWFSSVTASTSPYRRSMVVGGKYEVRSEILPRTDNVADADMVRLLATTSYVTNKYGGVSVPSDQMTISETEGFRGVKRNNIVVPSGMGGNGGSSSVTQQTLQKGKWSTKKLFGVTNLKDNMDRFATNYTEAYVPPSEGATLTIGYFDRIKDSDTAGLAHKVMPDIIARVKISYIVLASNPNIAFNEQA